jgi:hypothetical protein
VGVACGVAKSTVASSIAAIRCQLKKIAEYALAHDASKVHVRAALRDTLDKLKRPDEKVATFPSEPAHQQIACSEAIVKKERTQ